MTKASKKTNVTPMVKQDSNELSFSSQVLSRLEDMERRFENMFSNNWLKQLWGNHKEDSLPMRSKAEHRRWILLIAIMMCCSRPSCPALKKKTLMCR